MSIASVRGVRLAHVASFCLITGIAPPLLAQGFNNAWLTFTNDTAARLNATPTSVSSFDTEVDFAYGDLDKNGLADLVVARKLPNTTSGKRPNILFMNENGVLTDRTAAYASASDVPGDQGFLTPTNDRDVIVVDVDGDTWLDVVTSPVISFSDPKHISHVRIYRNLGNDSQGNWLGLRFENARFPQMFAPGGIATGTNACGVTAGDVNGDGAPDLYLIDYDNGEPFNQDLQDSLLLNDGNGFFTDASSLVSPSMTNSGFGTAGRIVDLNGDGKMDIAKSMAGPIVAAYNLGGAAQPLNLVQTAGSGSIYHMAAGDLNRDGRVDLIASDDGLDFMLYNTGNDALGRVNWSPPKAYGFLAGGDDSIGGNAHVVDLDLDGWNETIHADFDVDFSGCSRRLHIYHTPGGTVGGQIILREERESAGAGWVGAKGLQPGDLTGTYDTAHFDIEGDGDIDLVIGRCSGTYVWRNEQNPIHCQPTVAPTSLGDGTLSICGGQLESGQFATLAVAGGPANGIALLLLAAAPTQQPAFGGQILVRFSFAVPLPLDAAGALTVPVPGGGGPADGLTVYLQALLAAPAASLPSDLTNVLGVTFFN
jgi:hypothetical protein